MNKVASSYWVDARIAAHPAASSRSLAGAVPLDTRAGARRRARTKRAGFSSFAVFGMVIVTLFAFCLTVTLRTRAEAQVAATRYAEVNAEVESLRDANTELQRRVARLHTDPRAIEQAARERLGMVRPEDVIVPVK